MILQFLPVILGIMALMYAVLTYFSIKKYKETHEHIAEAFENFVLCNAEVIRPVVPNDSYAAETAAAGLTLLAAAFKIPAYFTTASETVLCEVQYLVNDEIIHTVILRQAGFHHSKQGDMISIFYDPKIIQHAFAEDMKDILLHKPFRECILNAVVTVVTAFSCIFLVL